MGDLFRQGSGIWRSLRDGDFEEEDVWDVLRDPRNSTSSPQHSRFTESSLPITRNLSTAARMIPNRATSFSSSSGSSNDSFHEAKVVQQSAPVNIPDWSHISRKKSKKASMNASPRLDHDGEDGDYATNGGGDDHDSEDDDDDDDEDEGDELNNHKLPPHEFIARRLARSQISSFSVFEGVGRTLKGRDLSKVRNSVLTKTGFLESL